MKKLILYLITASFLSPHLGMYKQCLRHWENNEMFDSPPPEKILASSQNEGF